MNEHEIRLRVYRATFDTNIFVRSLIQKNNLANRLISLWQSGSFILVLSQPIIDEVEEVLSRTNLRRKLGYTLNDVSDLIKLLHQTTIVHVTSTYELCRDDSDNKFVDCAISGGVQFLVSYDKDLIDDPELKKAMFEFGIEILEPPNFLNKITQQ